MKEVVFATEKLPYKFRVLTASLNMDGELVFDNGVIYFELNDDAGREVDDYLVVRTEHKARVLNLLGQAFNGFSRTCGETADDRLLFALARMARSGHWRSMDEIEGWLMDRDVPFTKRKLVDIK
jgi:hypothetical protein